jgi:hypothetical protein
MERKGPLHLNLFAHIQPPEGVREMIEVEQP